MTLSEFDADGITGSLTTDFAGGGVVSGTFHLPFVETGMGPPPGM
jgi:hypothetical protein